MELHFNMSHAGEACTLSPSSPDPQLINQRSSGGSQYVVTLAHLTHTATLLCDMHILLFLYLPMLRSRCACLLPLVHTVADNSDGLSRGSCQDKLDKRYAYKAITHTIHVRY